MRCKVMDMLEVYLAENKINTNKRIIYDIEDEFNTVLIKPTDLTKKLLKDIDKGIYDSENTFIDRFGVRLYTSELSTGCKAALLTEYRPDCIIDTKECGFNARDAIIQNCTTGGVIIHNTGMTFDFEKDNDKCDVCLDGYRFRTVDRLNKFIQDEMWDKESMDLSDLEKVK